MLELIIGALWFFLPAGVANGSPVIAAKIPYLKDLDQPIDGGKKYNGKRLFGKNKTYRGFVVGYIFALLTIYLQLWLFDNFEGVREISFFDYSSTSLAVLALLLAFGALGGDLVESFIKRQLGKKPGTSWMPWDQLDYIIGGLVLSSIMITLSLSEYLAVTLVWFVIHPLISHLVYRLKLRDDPF